MLIDHVNRVTQCPNNFGEAAPVRAHWSSKLELPIHELQLLVQDDWSAVNHWLKQRVPCGLAALTLLA